MLSGDKSILCRVVLEATTSAYMQAAVLRSSKGAGLMGVETHGIFVEHQCFMAAQCFMDILACAFLVYILNLTANPVNLPELMMVLS